MLTSITDEQCLRFRHTSKAFYTTALKLEVMKTAVVPTAHCRTAPTILVISLYVLTVLSTQTRSARVSLSRGQQQDYYS